MNATALICVASLGILLFVLGLVISTTRKNTNRFSGTQPDPADRLHKLVRAHGNTAEYVPFLAVLMLYLGAHDPAPWVVATMVAAAVCRYLFVVGMVAFPTMAQPNSLRFVGALGTYVSGVLLSIAALLTV